LSIDIAVAQMNVCHEGDRNVDLFGLAGLVCWTHEQGKGTIAKELGKLDTVGHGKIVEGFGRADRGVITVAS